MSELFSFGAWVRQRCRALDLTLEELAARGRLRGSQPSVTLRPTSGGPPNSLPRGWPTSCSSTLEERTTFVQAARGERATDRLGAPGAGVGAPHR